jgi:hypothetical protein
MQIKTFGLLPHLIDVRSGAPIGSKGKGRIKRLKSIYLVLFLFQIMLLGVEWQIPSTRYSF